MRTIILFLTIMLVATSSMAAVYVIVEDATGEIVSVSPTDDAVLEAGQTKVIKPNLDYATVILNHDPQDYKYINGNFVENIQKISDRENAAITSSAKQAEIKKVRNKAMKLACDKLITEGTTFTHITCADFE